MQLKNTSISIKLLVGFLLIISLFGIATYFNTISQREVSSQFNLLANSYTPRLIALFGIRDSSHDTKAQTLSFQITTKNISESEEIEASDKKNELLASIERLNGFKQAYLNTLTQEDLQRSSFVQQLDKVQDTVTQTAIGLINLKEQPNKPDTADKESELSRNIVELDDIVTAQINQVLTLAETQRLLAVASTNRASRFSLILSIASALLAVLIGLLISRSITKPVDILKTAALAIAAGKEQSIKITSRDEIGLLGEAFNSMSKNVQESHRRLEEEKRGIERKVVQRTEELRESLLTSQNERDKVSAIIQSIGDGVFVLDKNRLITSVNAVTMQLSGYEKRELIGIEYTQALKFISEKTNEASTEFIDRVYAEGAISAMENHTILIRKDGGKVPVSDSAAPLRDLEGNITGCVVVFRDVTKEREVERMKDDFLSMAAHQLRTPLTALRWQAQRLMRQKIGPLNPGQIELAQDINLSTVRLIDLVGQLLDVSHIETGTLLLHPSPTDVRPMIEDLIKLARLRYSDKHQEINFERPDDLPLLSIDSRLIAQVYQNLIVNACKYTPAEGKVTVSITVEGDKVISKVQDTGIGILEKDSENLFGRFNRGSSEAVNNEEGTGLGLYLAKKIVEASSGEIGFTPAEGTGTIFWFSLPTSKETAG